jgi:hypothetical protein
MKRPIDVKARRMDRTSPGPPLDVESLDKS